MPTRFYVDQRVDYENGKSFGKPGPYELILARALTDAGEGTIRVLKPRDPALGNNVLVFEVNGKGFTQGLDQGYTFVTLNWRDPKTAPAAAREIIDYLKLSGGPMLLGDQRRFLKHVIVIDANNWVAEFLSAGYNKDAKGRTLIDGVLQAIRGKQPYEGVRTLAWDQRNLDRLHALTVWIKDNKEPAN